MRAAWLLLPALALSGCVGSFGLSALGSTSLQTQSAEVQVNGLGLEDEQVLVVARGTPGAPVVLQLLEVTATSADGPPAVRVLLVGSEVSARYFEDDGYVDVNATPEPVHANVPDLLGFSVSTRARTAAGTMDDEGRFPVVVAIGNGATLRSYGHSLALVFVSPFPIAAEVEERRPFAWGSGVHGYDGLHAATPLLSLAPEVGARWQVERHGIAMVAVGGTGSYRAEVRGPEGLLWSVEGSRGLGSSASGRAWGDLPPGGYTFTLRDHAAFGAPDVRHYVLDVPGWVAARGGTGFASMG